MSPENTIKIKYKGHNYIIQHQIIVREDYRSFKGDAIRDIASKGWVTNSKKEPIEDRDLIKGILEEWIKSE